MSKSAIEINKKINKIFAPLVIYTAIFYLIFLYFRHTYYFLMSAYVLFILEIISIFISLGIIDDYAKIEGIINE